MKKDNRMNYCTASVQVTPEIDGKPKVRVCYSCEKNGYMVRGCKFFKPMTCAGGLHCYNECEYFENGCTNKRAKAACMERAYPVIDRMLAAAKGRTKKSKVA